MAKPIHAKTRERVLALLSEQGPMTTKQIAKAINRPTTVVGGIVSVLVRTELIVRVPPEPGAFAQYRLVTETERIQSEETGKPIGTENASEVSYPDRFWTAFLRKQEIPKL